VPYIFEEAICDIIGNYCTLEFAKTDPRIPLSDAQKQISINDSLYTAINSCISAIADEPEKLAYEQSQCEAKISRILTDANEFQKFRFGYTVNNGFLMKCRNYSWNYFLFKRIFLEQASLRDFIVILDQLSDNSSLRPATVENYRSELYSHTNWTLEVHFVWDSLNPVFADTNGFFLSITNQDPLNRFIERLNATCTPDMVNAERCMHHWNALASKGGRRVDTRVERFSFTGSEHFGKNWFVTSAFLFDEQVVCWMEEVILQLGKKTELTLSIENATLITTSNKK
jgi:hypothetical protein